MVDPPHPGEFIREVYLDPLEVSSRTVAAKLKVSPSTLTRLLNGQSSVTPETLAPAQCRCGPAPVQDLRPVAGKLAGDAKLLRPLADATAFRRRSG